MVFEKVKKLLAQQLSIEEDVVAMETTFEDLGADSLDVVELVMALEEEFDLQIADEDVENITTVGSIVEYINSRL